LKSGFYKEETEKFAEGIRRKLYNSLVLPTFLYGSENWTLTVSQRRRIEGTEMKLLSRLAGHAFNLLAPEFGI
jgi:hypothetical protein